MGATALSPYASDCEILMRSVFALTLVVASLASPAANARTRYPELMSNYDLSFAACKAGSRPACSKRDLYWRELRDAGYTLRQDPTNPNGYVWE